jgi:hypothetical protein
MTIFAEAPPADPSATATVMIGGEADLLRVRSTMRQCAHRAGIGHGADAALHRDLSTGRDDATVVVVRNEATP